MADYGVEITWGDAKPGRESKSLELFGDSVGINDKAVSNGKIDSWDAVIFEPSGAPPAGAIRMYGTQEQIEAFIRSEDFEVPVERAVLLLENVGIRRFSTGDGLADAVTRYATLVESL